jgi:hypothetical protein
MDVISLTFGQTGDEQSLESCLSGRGPAGGDEDGDGLPDLVCNFDVQKTGFKPGDMFGILKGKLLTGTPIAGVDSLRILGN